MLLMIPCFYLYCTLPFKLVVCHRQKWEDHVLVTALLYLKKKAGDDIFFIIELIEKKGN